MIGRKMRTVKRRTLPRLTLEKTRGLKILRVMASIGVSALLSGCGEHKAVQMVPGGHASSGKKAIVAYGCGSCHTIPGIPQARGLVGPALAQFALRTYIAGEVPNTPDQLIQWIKTPQAIEPGTAMPNLGVTEAQARDIAAYLYTLR
jgi:cytochrome c